MNLAFVWTLDMILHRLNVDKGNETAMLGILADWIQKRREIRRRWQHDAQCLLHSHGINAYYEAQRRAARARSEHDRCGFWHWAKVASEVARLSPDVEMDMTIVRTIADAETKDRPNC